MMSIVIYAKVLNELFLAPKWVIAQIIEIIRLDFV